MKSSMGQIRRVGKREFVDENGHWISTQVPSKNCACFPIATEHHFMFHNEFVNTFDINIISLECIYIYRSMKEGA
jgi:hypothetical protein